MATELIVALDLPHIDAIPAVVNRLPESVTTFKVGLELYTAAGPQALEFLKSRNKRIFLDLKLHDIPRTVARSVAVACDLNVAMLTVHASGGPAMLEAAAEASTNTDLNVIAVTTLTSLDQSDLTALGIARPLREHTLALGKLAIECGLAGLVSSPLETAAFRHTLGQSPLLVTPGIRPKGGDVGDQKRVATPAMAAQDGASHIVVGRPILEAEDPAVAAEQILSELHSAQQ